MTASIWVVHCVDGPGTAALRQELRPQHSRRLREGGLVRPLLYGPLTADGTEDAVGSLIVVEAPDRETVERHFAADPFRTGGVWERVRIDRFSPSERSPLRMEVAAPQDR
ncbi:YciI family protein [Streptomyces sp. NPDC005492]|uniref:YciI family protein n=1 Tax=Streptomyces sp. NPDC005492 TaxID=3156883 RepID=UPI0033B446EF